MGHMGKIARLPSAVRKALNRQLWDGRSQKEMVAWLNALPVVQEVLVRQFGGRPIVKQNLWAWRQRGYEEWALRRELIAEAYTRTRAQESCRTGHPRDNSTDHNPAGQGGEFKDSQGSLKDGQGGSR
ncbi:MAG: hypothetical protein JWR19_1943 [Pedosphaera sp.]|nr:hypothetical protein [Pedosphaera sp.]